jgi:signal transduction histidine kinase
MSDDTEFATPDGSTMNKSFTEDLAAIARIDAVPMILKVACHITGLRFAAVARVTEDRWIACAVRDEIEFGLQPGGELKVETTICNEVRHSGQMVVIDNVAEDEGFSGHPTPAMYGFQSYISVPINLTDGRFFGTLCALDPRPARLRTTTTIDTFRLFADLIAFHLDAQERLSVTQTALQQELQLAELREQFIAVLGHDLRNPLNSITLGLPVLLETPLNERARRVVGRIQNSVARMAGLINNVMDFARTRMGSGLSLTRSIDYGLAGMLEQVIAELQVVWPDRTIRSELSLAMPVACDSARISQLLSNLLANALTHGASDSPVLVHARSDDSGFKLSVTNHGKQIPPEAADRLFEPFSRASTTEGQQGLGLGLYIASEIAQAHGGTISVVSSSQQTCFSFRMPTHSGMNPTNSQNA